MNYNDRILQADFIVDMREELPRHKHKKWVQRDPAKIKGVVFHQSLEDYGTASGNARYHAGPNHISPDGLPGLSYTLFVDRKLGKVVLANSVEDITYSQGNRHIPGDENEIYLSVCWGGNFEGPGYSPPGRMTLTAEQWSMRVPLWKHLKSIFDLQDHQLFGHYHFGKAACPGFELSHMIDAQRSSYFALHTEIRFFSSIGRQDALKRLGYYQGEVDGVWGTVSKYALTQFQKSAQITVDGVWGFMTEAAILADLG